MQWVRGDTEVFARGSATFLCRTTERVSREGGPHGKWEPTRPSSALYQVESPLCSYLFHHFLTKERVLLEFSAARMVVLLLAALAFVACASPPWHGMSESEIAAWKGSGFAAEMAQEWKGKGFSVEKAGAWNANGFSADAAMKWQAKSFTPAEAKAWRTAGMSLKESVANRDKGLMPIAAQQPEAVPEKTAPETAEAAGKVDGTGN